MAARSQSKGSILVIILVTLVFAVTALVAFMDKASADLLVASHITIADRLRVDAYSALEVTLATLEDFREADSGLHSPGEGWGDPLAWAGWDPGDGNKVLVSFQDESGKLPLIRSNSTYLAQMFEYWQLPQDTSEHLADVLAGWMEKNHVSSTGVLPDYDQSATPYAPPLRAMRSFSELAAIDFVKDTFFDANGRPNDLWWRFTSDFSIFNFKQPNINGANADVLGGLGQFSDNQQQSLSDYLNGKGNYTATSSLGKQWFSNATDVLGVVGEGVGNAKFFDTTISALRILITVTQGSSHFDLSVVVSPKGGATIVTTTATNTQQGTANGATGETNTNNGLNTGTAQSNSTATAAQAAAASTASANLQYPFTILEILENDAILTPPPPPPPTT